ncbi:MAG: type III secretion system export apparatus subunit SctU [Pseudomonadota bacterium]
MSEKTEQPTPQRLRKAREDGNVPKSKDFTQILVMGALFGYALATSGETFSAFTEMLHIPARMYGVPFQEASTLMLVTLLHGGISLLMPYLLIVVVVGVLAETLQTGLLFSIKALMPKGDKLNPISNLKQMFSVKSFVEFIKNILKVIFLTVLVYMVVRDSLSPLTKVPLSGMGAAGLALGEMMKTLVIYVCVGFGAIALLDLVWQRRKHIKDLMMSMDEIKQEYKQMEGDPHVKGHRKELAKEIAMGEMVQKTRKASVVVTNPTHIAVALYYEEGKTPLPVVLSKGEGAIAEAIKRIAEEEGIPILQDVPLARALNSTAQLDQYIPSELIEPVARVLLTLRRLAQERELDNNHD